MVTPGGALLDFAALKAFFRTQRGTRQGLNIEINDMQVIVENEKGPLSPIKNYSNCPDRKQHAVFQHLCLNGTMMVMLSGGISTRRLCLKPKLSPYGGQARNFPMFYNKINYIKNHIVDNVFKSVKIVA